jgi:superfamily II DNA or RNA helicase
MFVMQQVCPVSIMKIVPPVMKAVSKSSKGTRLSDVLKADTQSAKKMEGSSSTGKMAEWEKRALSALQKHFAYKKLKAFQRDALEAWAENRDCFVLAATGSGISSSVDLLCKEIKTGDSTVYFIFISLNSACRARS